MLAQDVVKDSVLVREVRMEDTLRPVPWKIAVWDGESFRNEGADDRVLRTPLAPSAVGVSALGSPTWDFSLGLLGLSIPVGVPYWMNGDGGLIISVFLQEKQSRMIQKRRW